MKLSFRQVHLDFHTSPHIPGIGEKFDKKQWQDMLKTAHADSITCFSCCHHGMSYHPTKLGKISKEHHAKINLIPYNQTDRGFRRPKDKVIRQFMTEVEKAGGSVTCRKERGGSTDAACGQLRDRIEKKQTQQEIDHA